MQVADMMKPDGRVFLKSEWGQIDDGWPCVSFTKRSVGDRLRREFVVGRDVLIYVGTTDPEMTETPEHRSRLISVVTIEPNQILETRKIVPPEVWASSYATWGDRWPHAMAVLDAAHMIGPPYPHAREVIPGAYRAFSNIANRGGVVEATGDERAVVMDLRVERITLNLREDVLAYLKLRASLDPGIERAVRQEAYRMAMSVIERVKKGGEIGIRVNPQRTAPNLSDLSALFVRKWTEQGGLCALCGGKLVVSGNQMLQPSADRIDSADGAYNGANVWITHLACNLAKNAYGLPDFEEWISVIRTISPEAAE